MPDTTSRSPIGIFDSGVGGLTVMREIVRRLPHEDLIYVADAANCPYCPRSPAEIRRLSRQVAQFLRDQGAKVIVVACNTASAAALPSLRTSFGGTPFVGMVPAVKPASASTRSGIVGVLATPATVGGDLYGSVVEHFARHVRIVEATGDGLVAAVERGDVDGLATEALLKSYLAPMQTAGADTIVLGCTHYLFLEPAIRRIMGPSVNILDPSPAIAQHVERVLAQTALLAQRRCQGQQTFFTSGAPVDLADSLQQLLGLHAPVQHLPIGTPPSARG